MWRGRVAVAPFDGFESLVILADITHQLATQIGNGSEDTSCDNVAFDLGEPQLDLVEPGRISRNEAQVNIGVAIQELGDLLGFVSRQVIGDHVDLPGRGLVDDDVGQEGNERRRSVPRRRLAQHLSGSGVECRIQRQRAMTMVLKAVPLRPAGRQR
jgi:hypothetical protein